MERDRGTGEIDLRRLDTWMALALDEARAAAHHNEVPVGAIVVRRRDGEIVAARHNERETSNDPTAHAELLALRDAARVEATWRLDDHIVVVTLEPCPMCAGAIWAARARLLVFGAADPKAGAAGTLYNFASDPRLNHTTDVMRGVRGSECAALLADFFASRRTAP